MKPIISDDAHVAGGMILEMRSEEELILALEKFPIADEDEEHMHPARQAARLLVKQFERLSEARKDYLDVVNEQSHCTCQEGVSNEDDW